jgi:hypothetical protein
MIRISLTRILPEMCANISWPLSSLTLKVVLGKFSKISPSNLTNSLLFDIFVLKTKDRRIARKPSRNASAELRG